VASRRRLIVVSNRGPVGYTLGADGARVARRGGGGLVTALRSLVAHHDVTWIASAIGEEDRAVATDAGGAFEETLRGGARCRLRLVVHDPAAYDRYYNVVANPTLWFLQHDLWELLEDRGDELGRAWEDGYVPVNRAFAEAVLEELAERPDATVFFHDYHLYVAPVLVRNQRPDALLAHFTHIPWPPADRWRVLPAPVRHAIHAGLVANDVVAFHTERWAGAFRESAAEVLGPDALAGTTVAAHPISIDPSEFEELASSPTVLEAGRRLDEERPERLVLRVDRTDPSKNVVRGVLAFERMLETMPEAVGRVGMRALLDPSRQTIPEYVTYLEAIRREIERVNERFGRDGWLPIDLCVQDDFAASVAAYKQFDVLLVNSVYDGLNLVAKEAPLVNERDGVLVLSRNAGAFEELADWVVPVDPLDVEGQAAALREALALDVDERRRRLDAIRGWVQEHGLERWLDALLADFDAAAARKRPAASR
jgi:trehalose 6-phosphate synthase